MGDLVAWLRNQLDRAVAVGAALLGALFLLLGWVGVSGASLTTEQIPFLASGAVGGLFLLGVAATLWLSSDLRDEWRKLDDIYELMQEDRRNATEAATGKRTSTERPVANGTSGAKTRRSARSTT